MLDTRHTEVPTDTPATMGGRHEPRCAGVRPVVVGDHQRRGLHLVRLQLLQAEDGEGLADVWYLLRVYRRAFRGDVRISADDLSDVRLAGATVSWRRSAEPRLRSPVVLAARLQRQPALEPDSHPEQRGDRGRLHPA